MSGRPAVPVRRDIGCCMCVVDTRSNGGVQDSYSFLCLCFGLFVANCYCACALQAMLPRETVRHTVALTRGRRQGTLASARRSLYSMNSVGNMTGGGALPPPDRQIAQVCLASPCGHPSFAKILGFIAGSIVVINTFHCDFAFVQVVVRELFSKKSTDGFSLFKFEDYVEFWRLMDDPDEAGFFAARLVKLIVTVLKNIHKTKNLAFLCNLIHTLHYVDLMFSFDGEHKDSLSEQIELFEAAQVGRGCWRLQSAGIYGGRCACFYCFDL